MSTPELPEQFDAIDIERMRAAVSFSALFMSALPVLRRLQPMNPVMAAGFIDSSSQELFGASLLRLEAAIRYLVREGWTVFNTIPLELRVEELRRLLRSAPNPESRHPNQTFYGALFRSGLLATVYFPENWQESMESAPIHATATLARIPIHYLPL